MGLPLAKSANAVQDGKVTIALVLKSLADPFSVAMAGGAQNYQKHYASQFDLTVRGTATETDTLAQTRIVDELIGARTNAIVLASTDSKALIPVVARGINAGVIVISIDNPLDEAAQDADGISVPFVGTDNRRGAAQVGKYLAGKLKPGDEVGIIEGVSADRNAQQRTAGCKDAMNAAGIRIVAIQPGDWEYGKGKEAASQMLSEHPRIRALMCGNDNMAMGAVEAVPNAPRTGPVYVTGHNKTDAVKPLPDTAPIPPTLDHFSQTH